MRIPNRTAGKGSGPLVHLFARMKMKRDACQTEMGCRTCLGGAVFARRGWDLDVVFAFRWISLFRLGKAAAVQVRFDATISVA